MTRRQKKGKGNTTAHARQPDRQTLGEGGYAWSSMQKNLSLLFCRISGLNESMGLGIWRTLKSGCAQYELLEAAVLTASVDKGFLRSFPKAREDLQWLLNVVNLLAFRLNGSRRDEAISQIKRKQSMQQLKSNENITLKGVLGEDKLTEFESYIAYCAAIGEFAATVSIAIDCRLYTEFGLVGPWPDRPQLLSFKGDDGVTEFFENDGAPRNL